ncbi:hypothetical protein PS914_02828 [Pseudomonas fluorescens]|nr:hypothetical protein PS914_02828 [Pseudomonas fluorescens]
MCHFSVPQRHPLSLLTTSLRLLEGARAVNQAAGTLSQGSKAVSANTGDFSSIDALPQPDFSAQRDKRLKARRNILYFRLTHYRLR